MKPILETEKSDPKAAPFVHLKLTNPHESNQRHSDKIKSDSKIPPLKGHWIKLHSSILESRHHATLSDHLWAILLKVSLWSGRADNNKSGIFEVEDAAFGLRILPECLADDLRELVGRGFLEDLGEGRYRIINLVEECRAETAAERKAKERFRKTNPQTLASHDDVTNRDVEEKRRDIEIEKNRGEEIPAETTPAPADLVGELASRLSAPKGDEEPNAVFWDKMKGIRPDLDIPSVKTKWESYCRDKRLKMTCDHAESWVKREKSDLRVFKSQPERKVEKPKPKVDETHARTWLHENFDNGDHFMRFAEWPPFAKQEYLKSIKVDVA